MNLLEIKIGRFTTASEMGLRLFPVKARSKEPALRWSEFADRAPTQEELTQWEASDCNVAVITGEPSGIAVLDVDSTEAQEFVDTLELPVTPVVSTGKGRHYYFKLPAGGVRNKTGIAGHKLDLRGDGGYVVGAGSIHPSGRCYEWAVSPDEVAFADFPLQLLELISTRNSRPKRLQAASTERTATGGLGKFDNWLSHKVRDAATAIGKSEEGTRNDRLFHEGAKIASDVAGARASWAEWSAPLREAALLNGLDKSEIEATLASCWQNGSQSPTPWMITAGEWIYLNKPDVFYHIESGEYVRITAFSNMFASQRVAKGPFHLFLLNGDFVTRVHDLTYEPKNAERFVEQDGIVLFNTFRPSGIEPVPGDWVEFENYISYLVPDATERDHLLKMMAWTVRNPGQKLRHALLLRSEEQGIGKTMLTEIWGALLGKHNVRKTTTEEVAGQFQGFIKETLLVVLEELNWGVGPMGYNRLKDLITADVASVNEKFMPVRAWPNYATFVILTNLKTPMIIEKGDRRIFHVDSPAKKRSPEYYAGFARWWRANLGIIRAFLETVDLTEFNPHAEPPLTESKQTLIADGREDLVKELAIAAEDRAGPFSRDIVDFEEIEALVTSSLRGKGRTQLRDALKAIGAVPLGQQRVPGIWQFGRFVRVAHARASLWAVRHPEYWVLAGAKARGDEYGRDEGRFAYLHGLPIGVRHISEMPVTPRTDEDGSQAGMSDGLTV